jgi:hypothetical protein
VWEAHGVRWSLSLLEATQMDWQGSAKLRKHIYAESSQCEAIEEALRVIQRLFNGFFVFLSVLFFL